MSLILSHFKLLHDMDLSLAMVLLSASSATSNIFVYCFFGMLATCNFVQMSDCLYYNSNWYNFSIKLQKYLVIMIANMQEPIYYHGFEVAKLDLRTFIQARAVYSLH